MQKRGSKEPKWLQGPTLLPGSGTQRQTWRRRAAAFRRPHSTAHSVHAQCARAVGLPKDEVKTCNSDPTV